MKIQVLDVSEEWHGGTDTQSQPMFATGAIQWVWGVVYNSPLPLVS